MNRRSFLKVLGIGAGVAAIAPKLVIEAAAYPHFDPRKQYGDYIRVSDMFTPDLKREIVQYFDKQITDTVPYRYRKNIKYIFKELKPSSADPLCQWSTAGWKYVPEGTA
jgi:hypothetical protein